MPPTDRLVFAAEETQNVNVHTGKSLKSFDSNLYRLAKDEESEGSNVQIMNTNSIQKFTTSNFTLGLTEDRSLIQKLDGQFAKKLIESMSATGS